MSNQAQGADGAGTFDHEFKSHPDVFWPAARGEKTFEYRRDDRGGYEVGQTVRLRCFDPAIGYEDVAPLDRRITNVLRGGEFELPQGYCILSLAPLADGAGTKTAKPGDLLYRSEWETKRTITHEDAREIAGRLIASHFRRTDCETARASIPANPDYDDDLLINSYIKQQARKEAAPRTDSASSTTGEEPWTFDRTRSYLLAELERLKADLNTIGEDLTDDQGKAVSWLDVARGRAANVSSVLTSVTAPAPSSPGVPDSVREAVSALLSACMMDMGPLDEMDRDDEPVGMNGFGVGTAVTFGHLRRLEQALATHPAGQSAENVHNPSDTSRGLDGEWYCELHPEKTFGHDGCCGAGITSDQRIFVLVNQRRLAEQSVRECHYMYKDLISPAGQSAGSGAKCPECFGSGLRDIDGTSDDKCAACDGAGEPAPDSTRTGQVSVPLVPTEAMWRAFGTLTPEAFRQKWTDALAARPEAPEAQGAWLPISTAPRNDKLVMLGWWCDVGGDPRWIAVAGWYEAGPADQCWYAAYDEERVEPTHWQPLGRLPAPPASSGQGGR